MKILARHQDYDENDCTSGGHDWELREDGSIAATRHTCWQGAVTGRRVISAPGLVDVSKIDESDPDNDAEAALVAVAEDESTLARMEEWRCVRAGTRIQ
jgi:hypothetical protein